MPEDDGICLRKQRPHSDKAPHSGTGIVNHGDAVSTETDLKPFR
jgi:hypothetical protein